MTLREGLAADLAQSSFPKDVKMFRDCFATGWMKGAEYTITVVTNFMENELKLASNPADKHVIESLWQELLRLTK